MRLAKLPTSLLMVKDLRVSSMGLKSQLIEEYVWGEVLSQYF
jgi:hypothetical protein